MTISSETNRISYTGSGGTGPFAVPFYFLEDNDLKVIRRTIADGTEVVMALTTDYTLTGAGVAAGGSLTLVAALSASYQLVIIRDPDVLQSTVYPAADKFPSASHERALDKLTMLMQRVKELVTRSLRLSDGSQSTASLTIPEPAANSFFGWNAAGTALINYAIQVGTTLAEMGSAFHNATNKATPVDADEIPIADSAASFGLKKLTWANLKTTLQDTLGFIQSGAGAVAQISQSKLRESVSLADFGAVGDASDEQSKIQAAVDYAESIGMRYVRGDPSKTYSVGSAINLGVSGSPVILDLQGGTLQALTAFTGGLVIITQGGVHNAHGAGAGVSTSGHNFITLGTALQYNPVVDLFNLTNDGGFYDFVKTIYEFDNAVIDLITSNVTVGHAVLDLDVALAGSVSYAASPKITRLSLRNPVTTRVVGDPIRYGIILNDVEDCTVSGVISNFDNGLYCAGNSRQLNIENLLVADLRSTPTNDLWESAWAATTAYTVGQYRKPTAANANGHFYLCTTGGTSGGTEPTWPTAYNDTVVDGTVTWTEVGQSINISVGALQQFSMRNVRSENAICAFANLSNANMHFDSVRLVGESIAYGHFSGSNAELFASNCLFSGDVMLNAQTGGTTTRFIGINNLVSGDTLGQLVDHEADSVFRQGTTTPTISGATTAGSGTYTTQLCKWTKIGRRVFFSLDLAWSAHTGTGKGRITTGLPYLASADMVFPVSIEFINITYSTTAGHIPIALVVQASGATQVRLYIQQSAGTRVEIDIDTAGQLVINGSFYV